MTITIDESSKFKIPFHVRMQNEPFFHCLADNARRKVEDLERLKDLHFAKQLNTRMWPYRAMLSAMRRVACAPR